jgi:formate hydrogenlyase transcriptional activator
VVSPVGILETAALSSAAAVSGATVPFFDDAMRDLLRRALEAARGRIHGPGGAADPLRLKPTTLPGKLRKCGMRER